MVSPDFLGAPEWFLRAVAKRPQDRYAVTRDGVRLHFVCWNPDDTAKPPLLFLHGYRAHSRIWDGIAPFFIEQFQVFAMDFAGMGESSYRDSYSLDSFDEDIVAVVEAIDRGAVTLVGHSFGGGRVARFCGQHPERVGHAVLIDAFMHFLEMPGPHSWPVRGRRPAYPDYESILARYRLVPEQPAERWMFNYIAHHSVKQTEDGWVWKFDPRLPGGHTELDGTALLKAIQAPLDIVLGERSGLISAERLQLMLTSAPRSRGAVTIPEAHHHIMFDQPLALISALRALLAIEPQPWCR